MYQFENLIEIFKRLELKWHVLLSFGLLLCFALLGVLYFKNQQSELANKKTELITIQNDLRNRTAAAKLKDANNIENTGSKKNFTELLSSSSKSDEVVREMSRLAVGKGIGLDSLKITPIAGTTSEHVKVQYNVTMKTDYYLFKGWLGGLLSRYPALGVNTLSIRGIATDNTKQDINLSLLLYIKD